MTDHRIGLDLLNDVLDVLNRNGLAADKESGP